MPEDETQRSVDEAHNSCIAALDARRIAQELARKDKASNQQSLCETGVSSCGLGTFNFDVQAFGSVPSTNIVIKDALVKGRAEGLVVTSLVQKAGYGRQGRKWESPVGGLYFSCALRPSIDQDISSFALVASLSLLQTLISLGAPADLAIKWPNDLLCRRGKICGISLELHSGALCLGVGINVFPSHQRLCITGKNTPSYLYDECVTKEGLNSNQKRLLEDVLIAVLSDLRIYYQRWQQKGFEAFQDSYNHALMLVGQSVEALTIDGASYAKGVVQHVDKNGRLLLQTEKGELTALSSGEIHLARISR